MNSQGSLVPEYREKGTWSLLHNNATTRKYKNVGYFLTKNRIVVLVHQPCSPDLEPCDFWIFPKLKLSIKGKLFDTIRDIQKASITIQKTLSIVMMTLFQKALAKCTSDAVKLLQKIFEIYRS